MKRGLIMLCLLVAGCSSVASKEELVYNAAKEAIIKTNKLDPAAKLSGPHDSVTVIQQTKSDEWDVAIRIDTETSGSGPLHAIVHAKVLDLGKDGLRSDYVYRT